MIEGGYRPKSSCGPLGPPPNVDGGGRRPERPGDTSQFVTACAVVSEVLHRERAECALAKLVRVVTAPSSGCPVTEALSEALTEAHDVLAAAGVRVAR